MYDDLLNQSRRLMKRGKIRLSPLARCLAARVMAESLLFHDVELIDLCVDEVHFHLLARFTPVDGQPLRDGVATNRSPRHLVGIAKKRAARALSDTGLVPPGGVWGKRCGRKPIRDRAHQINVARYIPKHGRKGAAVLSDLKRMGLLDLDIPDFLNAVQAGHLEKLPAH